MKKIIAIAFILMIGLFILEGCAPTTEPPLEEQEPIPKPEEQDQKPVESEEIPQPPAFPGE